MAEKDATRPLTEEEAARLFMGRERSAAPLRGRVQWGVPPTLLAYLVRLQKQYPQPFDADHIVALVVGWAGPWIDPAGPRLNRKEKESNEEDKSVPLLLIRNQLKKLRRELKALQSPGHAATTRRTRAEVARHNRKVGLDKAKVIAIVREEEGLKKILERLDSEHRHLRDRSRRDRRLGITRSPGLPETQHWFWTPIAYQLVRYLERSGASISEKKRCEIVARILHLASAGAFPAGSRGAADMKARYYRSLP